MSFRVKYLVFLIIYYVVMVHKIRARHWCFTLNNYTEDDVGVFRSVREGVLYFVVGEEVGKCGTPHLQGFVSFTNARSFESVCRHFDGRAHWEPARLPYDAAVYCRKDGNFIEHGVPPAPAHRGSRSDLTSFKEAVKGGCLDHKRLREDFSDLYAKYSRFCLDYVQDHTPLPDVFHHALYNWQLVLQSQLVERADSRTIRFMVDLRGNSGKSWFCDFYHKANPETSQVLTPGKVADMSYTLNPSISVLFLDCPRSKQGDFIQYDFLEHVKNGRVFSPKYESKTKYLSPCHVVVMMNEFPDYTKLSEDRYLVTEVAADDSPPYPNVDLTGQENT